MALFWMIATVVILASSLLTIAWEAFKAVILTDEDSSPVEDNRSDANGFKPDNPFYSKLGTINPAFQAMLEKGNEDW
jgi:hypothetical protein